MGRKTSRAWAGLVLLGVTGGCVEQERPGGPFAPEEPPPTLGAPIVRIVQPVGGQRLTREELTTPPGVEVTLAGEFPAGHFLTLEAYQNNHALPFTTLTLELVPGEPAPTRLFILATVEHLFGATQATVTVDVREGTGVLISRDEVLLNVR